MNKIYRKVWNKALGRIVVASEFARSDSTGVAAGVGTVVSGPSHATLMLAVALGLASMGASAQEVQDLGPDGTLIIGQTELDNAGLRVGNGVAVGASTVRAGTVMMDAVANDLRGLSNTTWNPTASYTAGRAATEEQLKQVSDVANAGFTVGTGNGSVNIGPGGTLTFEGDGNISMAQTGTDDNGVIAVSLDNNLDLTAAGSVTIGASTLNNNGLAVGGSTLNGTGLRITGGPSVTSTGINAGNQVITNVADGLITNGSTQAVNGGQIYELRNELNVAGQGVKYFHARSQEDGTATGDSQAQGMESIAIGPNAVSAGGHSLAAGDGASTALTAEAAIAMGRDADAQAAGAIVVGDQAAVDSQYATDAVALGTGATVSGESANAIALGAGAAASAANATAVGAGAVAAGTNSIALGQATASAANAFAAGNGAEADSPNGIALGTGAGVGTTGTAAGDRTSHIAIGTGAGVNVQGNQTMAIGYMAGTGVVGDQNVAIGSQAGSNINGDYNVAIGFHANQVGGAKDRAVAVGSDSVAGTDAAALGYNAAAAANALALGSGSSADASAVALGRNARAEGGHIALGAGSAAVASDYMGQGYLTGSPQVIGGSVLSVGNTSSNLQRRIVNVADGAQRYDAVNVGQLQMAQAKIANLVGGGVTVNAEGDFSAITLMDTDQVPHSFQTIAEAIGAVSSGEIDVLPADAVRLNALGGISGVAAGVSNTDVVNVAQMNQAIADNKSQYVSINSTDPANRDNAGATGTDAVAIGPRSDAAGREALAVGYEASADQEGAVALGRDVKALAASSTAIGDGSYANDEGGIAIGSDARSTGENSVVIGTGAQADPKLAGGSVDNAIVVGTEAEVSADDGIAIGRSALASEERAVAHGYDAHATAIDAMAEGTRSRATGLRSQASGTDAQASGVDAVASGTNSRGYAANGVALGAGAIAGMDNPLPEDRVNNVNAVAIGNGAMAVNRDATAMGTGAYANAESALATGTNARATAISAVASGTGALASGQSAVATGTNAEAQGYGSSAIGLNARATEQYSVANGTSSQATAIKSYAAGYDARAGAVNAMALGSNASAQQEGAVALGSGSITAAAENTPNAVVDKVTYTFAGTTATSTVSIGAANAPRTLTNLAAGRISASSTDAINGSQLFGTNQAVTALGNNLDSMGSSVASGLGQYSSYNSETHQISTRFQLGTNSYNTVQDALARAASGINLTAQGSNSTNVGPTSATGSTMDLSSANGNIAVTKANNSNDVLFTLANNLNLGATGSVNTGNTLVDNSGAAVVDAISGNSTRIGAGEVTVRNGTYATSVGPTGITVGGAHAIAINGTTGTIGGLTNTTFDPANFTSGQAASEDQLKLVSDTANAGWTVSVEGGNATNVGNASASGNTMDLSSGDGNVLLRKSATSNDIEFALADNIDLGAAGSVTTGNTVLNNAGVEVNDGTSSTTVSAGSLAVSDGTSTTSVGATSISVGGGAIPITINGATGTIGGLTNTTFDPTNFTSGQAASEDQLKSVSDVANAGWNVSAEGANGSNVAVSSATGNNVDLRSADGNIVVSKTATSNDIEFALADDLDVAGSVTVGNTTLANNGLTIINGPSITSAGVDAAGTRVTNVATGVDGGDAVNVDQLDDTIEARRTRYYSVNSTGGGNEANDGATGADAIAAGRDAEAEGDEAVAMGVGAVAAGNGSLAFGGGAQARAVNSMAFGAGAVASHGNSIAMGAGSVTTVGAQANYQGAYVGTSSSTGEMNIGGRQVTGVAAGSAATDAANVGQLTAGVASAVSESNQYTDTQIGAVSTRIDGIDNRVTNIEGDLIDIRGDITDIRNDVVDIQGDITDLDGRMGNVESDLAAANQNTINIATKVDDIEHGADGMFQVSQDGDLVKPQVSGRNSAGGGQGAVASGENSTALGNQAVASGANSTAIGQGAVASHDNSVALGQGSKTTVGAQSGYNAAYVGSSTSTGEVNIGGRTMTGVAAGIAGTDATNVNQLTAGVNQAITSANQYTDSRIGKVENDMWQLDRGYRGATASAMAMAGLPQAYMPGKSMLSMALGGYQSEYGMALGLSGITDNGRWVYKAQASGNTVRDWGFSMGAGIQW